MTNIERPATWFEPDVPKPHYCANCGAAAVAYGDSTGYLCEDCMDDTFMSFTLKEKIEALGMEVL